MRRESLLITALCLGVFAMSARAEEKGGPLTITGSTVKAVGQPYCDGGQEYQAKALVGSFKDSGGKIVEQEMHRWAEATGKSCTEKARGNRPAGPNAAGVAAADKEMAGKEKTRGGPCGCYYKYWYRNGCIYYEYYDCDWNYCGYRWFCN